MNRIESIHRHGLIISIIHPAVIAWREFSKNHPKTLKAKMMTDGCVNVPYNLFISQLNG